MKIRNLIEAPNLAKQVDYTEFLALDKFKHEFHTLIGRAELRIPYERKFALPKLPTEHPALKNNPGKRQKAFPSEVTWAQPDLWQQAADISMEKNKLDRSLIRLFRERENAKAAAEERYLHDIYSQEFRIDQTFVQKFKKEQMFRDLKKAEKNNEFLDDKKMKELQTKKMDQMKELYREQRGWDNPSTLPESLQGTGARNLFEYFNDQRMLHITSLSSDVHDLKEILKMHDAQMHFAQAAYGLISTGQMVVANAQVGAVKIQGNSVEKAAPAKVIRFLK